MPTSCLRLFAATLGIWLSACAVGWAQPASGSAPIASGGPPPAKTEGVHEVKPDLLYLRDKDGKLQPVLGFTLEDFERLMTTGAARGNPTRPVYRLDKVDAKGTVKEDRAELTVEFTIFVDDKDWVRVPLRLGNSVVRGQVRYSGSGELFLEYDDENDEYVAWLHGQSEKPHRLTLDVISPVTMLAGETRFKLSTPRAWNSALLLTVPGGRMVGQVSPGTVLDATVAKGENTEFKVLGLTSDFTLTWRQAESRGAEVPAVLEASGALLARIDGRSVNTQAQLTVRSFGGEFDTFRVRLPPGAILLTGDQSEYTLRPVEPEKKAVDPKAKPAEAELPRRVVEVRLQSKTTGPVHVRLVTEQTYDVANKQDGVDLAGFEVVDAVRQWGHLAVQVVGDWQVLWGDRRHVRQVEDLPAEVWRDNILAGFEYFAQPFSLTARITPRETRLSIEPDYLVLVGAHRLELEGRLKYRIGGAKAFNLEVDVPGWTVDEIGPANRVDTNELITTDASPLTIPLSDPALGDLELVLRAHLDVPSGAKTIDFELPRPRAAAVGSASLVVLPADNVDVSPTDKLLRGLVRQFIEPTMKLPQRQQEPLVYRSDPGQTRFVAGLHVHQRQITVRVRTRLAIGEDGGQVQQQFLFNVAREPVDSLSLEVPSGVVEQGKLEVELSGQPLTWEVTTEPTAQPRPNVLVRVALPTGTIGACELTTRYPWTEEKPLPRTAAAVRVPLVMPADGELTSNELTVEGDGQIRYQNLDGMWQRREPSKTESAGATTLWLVSDVARAEVVLGVHAESHPDSQPLVIDRAWIQSWLSDHARQERVVYRLSSYPPRLHVKIPAAAKLTEVSVNGNRVTPAQGKSAEGLTIPLPAGESSDKPATVELRYHFLDRKRLGSSTAMEIKAPSLDKGVWAGCLYWQLMLPPGELVLTGPDQFTDESSWSWDRAGWARQPLMDQFELETWTGARHDAALPKGLNTYLFSAIGDEHVLEVRSVRLATLVLFASGFVLAVGLVLIYFPAMRHPALLLVASLALLPLAAIAPHASLLLAQAAGLGLLLSLVSAWMRRRFQRRHMIPTVARSGPSSILERGSTRTVQHHRPQVIGSHTSTATAPIAAQLSAPDADS